MKFHILTIFPKIFDSYFKESILKRAQEKKLIKINIHNIRDFTKDKHRKVDDAPYGGGPGMVLKIEPIFNAVQLSREGNEVPTLRRNVGGRDPDKASGQSLGCKTKTRVILFSARGKRFDQKTAQRLAKYDQLILICGRYEGVDERVAKYIADEEISMGDFVLSGGELPAMILVEGVSRFVPGVLGKKESLEIIKGSYPSYTRPEVFGKWRVPKVLLSGNHKKIEEWRSRFDLKKKIHA